MSVHESIYILLYNDEDFIPSGISSGILVEEQYPIRILNNLLV